jgi:hypothetical protein
VSSRIGNGFRDLVLRESVRDVGCSLRCLRVECVRDLPRFRGMHRFLPALVRLGGHEILEVPVGHRPRRFGRAKYGISNRMWSGILDTFGVRWLMSRHQRVRVRESSEAPGGSGDRAATS